MDITAINEKINNESAFIELINCEISKAIVGQKGMIDRLLIGILSNGHILLEGVPGLAKTLAIKSLAAAMKSNFRRIQFTPDLLPADLIGTQIFNQKENSFFIRKGPIFSNFILADEINRAPAKVQSALLEAMQERQITIGEETFKLDDPFLVLATQNPIEQEGTYQLPEAQVDRFMLKVVITYPTKEQELEIMRKDVEGLGKDIQPVVSPAQIIKARQLVKEIYIDEKIEKYILDIVFATRNPMSYGLTTIKDFIKYGGSPRASINLVNASKAMAFVKRRGYVIPDDVRNICYDILRHRISLTYEAEAEEVTTENIITEILNKIEVP